LTSMVADALIQWSWIMHWPGEDKPFKIKARYHFI